MEKCRPGALSSFAIIAWRVSGDYCMRSALTILSDRRDLGCLTPETQSVWLKPALLLALCMLGACAGSPPLSPPLACTGLYTALENYARLEGLSLSEPRHVDAFPALASNRLLASFDPDALSVEQRADWLARLQAAGSERRRMLLGMLRDRSLAKDLPDELRDLQGAGCEGQNTVSADDPDLDWQALWNAVQIKDDYLGSRRILGVYPLTSIFAGLGVAALQRDIYASYERPLADIPLQGHLQRYAFAPTGKAGTSVQSNAGMRVSSDRDRDSLGLTLSPGADLRLAALFARHAPVLEIDAIDSYDFPGEPYFDPKGLPRVAGESAYGYRYPSLMPFAGQLRLQLNYVFWFDQRPASTLFDSLSGRLDGLVWRVTLDSEDQVLLYDSIHSCGCYQQFFLTDRVRARVENAALKEPLLLPQSAPTMTPATGAPVLRISSGAHYLERVYTASPDIPKALQPRPYALADYASLYSLQSGSGPRSLFGEHGIVEGTQRGERFYLWPLGIRSPGAMRERGRQPTAFLGRRHFDDADLLDGLFRLLDP